MRKDYYAYGMGLQVVSESDLDAIHDATLDVLSTVGIRCTSKKAQEVLASAGCTIDAEKDIIFFPPHVVMDALSHLPKEWMTYGVDPEMDWEVELNKVRIGNSGICPYIVDLYTGERRATTLDDVAMTARIVDAIDEFPSYMLTVPAQDVPQPIMSLYQSAAILQNTSKHFVNMHDNCWVLEKQLRMYELVAGGKEKFKERPFCGLIVCPVSPLEIMGEEADMMFLALDYNMPVTIFNDIMSGSTAPATLAGTMVVMNAEILAGVTLAQIIKPGTCVRYGTSSTIMDFRNNNTPIGGAEHGLVSAATAQLARRYSMPSVTGGL